MSRHLEVLRGLFPGKVMLNVEDIASLTNYSKGHIYNLACTNELPFKVSRTLGDKILVSIIEMADYLDSDLLSKRAEPELAPQSEPKKRGRPRGTTNAALQIQLFQTELSAAIFESEVTFACAEMQRFAESISHVASEDLPADQQISDLKVAILNNIAKVHSTLARVKMDLVIGAI